MTPEAKVKKRVRAELEKRNGVYYFMPATHGYGSSGVPDIVACINGRFIGIECKAGKGVPTALQERELKLIAKAGGVTFVIREDTLDVLEYYFAQEQKAMTELDDRDKKENT